MAALITLTAVPGHIERHASYSTKTVEIWGRELGRITKPVATIAKRSPGGRCRGAASRRDVRDAVQAFDAAIREREPDSSFAVLVGVRRGDRKPGGFDAAQRGNGFGQDDFLHVRDEHPEEADAPTRVPAPVPPAAA